MSRATSGREPKWIRRRLLRTWPVRAALRTAGRFTAPRAGEIVVAMFHRTLDASRFGEQLDALLEGRSPVSGTQVVRALEGRGELPPGAVWLTFDDAYGDFKDVALPVLRARGLPATQFVPTAFVGTNPADFWWERLAAAFEGTEHRGTIDVGGDLGLEPLSMRTRAARTAAFKKARGIVKSLPHAEGMALVDDIIDLLGSGAPAQGTRVLDWDELVELQGQGVEFGGHTHTHPMLDRVDHGAAQAEIRRGFDLLRSRLTVLPVLAYPSGQYNAAVVDAARHAGALAAVTTRSGVHRLAHGDPFEIPRVSIGPFADGAAVRLRLILAALHGR